MSQRRKGRLDYEFTIAFRDQFTRQAKQALHAMKQAYSDVPIDFSLRLTGAKAVTESINSTINATKSQLQQFQSLFSQRSILYDALFGATPSLSKSSKFFAPIFADLRLLDEHIRDVGKELGTKVGGIKANKFLSSTKTRDMHEVTTATGRAAKRALLNDAALKAIEDSAKAEVESAKELDTLRRHMANMLQSELDKELALQESEAQREAKAQARLSITNEIITKTAKQLELNRTLQGNTNSIQENYIAIASNVYEVETRLKAQIRALEAQAELHTMGFNQSDEEVKKQNQKREILDAQLQIITSMQNKVKYMSSRPAGNQAQQDVPSSALSKGLFGQTILKDEHKVRQALSRLSQGLQKTRKDFQNTRKSITRFSNRLSRLGRRISQISRGLRNLGRNLQFTARDIMFTVGAVSAFAGLAVKAYLDAEESMIRYTQATIDANSEMSQFQERLHNNITMAIDLSKQYGSLGVSVNDVSTALTTLAQKGLAGTSEEGEILDTILKNAAVSFTEVEISADAVTGIFLAFQELLRTTNPALATTAEQIGYVSDVIVHASNKSTAGVSDMRTAMQYVSGIAGQYGITLEETAAALVTLDRANLPPSVSSRRLASVFGTLISKGRDYIGVMKDENNQFIGLGSSLELLRTRYQGIVDTQGKLAGSEFLTEVFGAQQAEVVSKLLTNQSAFNNMVTDMKAAEGATDSWSDALSKTLTFQVKQLANAFDVLRISIGSAIGKELKESGILIDLTERMNLLQPLFERVGAAVGKAFVRAVNMAIHYIDRMTLYVADLANSGKFLEDTIKAGTTEIELFLRTIGSGMIGNVLNHIADAVALLGRVITDVIGDKAAFTFDEFIEKMSFAAIGALALAPALAGMGVAFEALSIATGALSVVPKAATTAVSGVGQVSSAILGIATLLGGSAIPKVKAFLTAIGGVKGILSAFGKLFVVVTVIIGALGFFKGLLDGIFGSVGGMEELNEVFGKLWKIVGKLAEVLFKAGAALFKMFEFLGRLVARLFGFNKAVGDGESALGLLGRALDGVIWILDAMIFVVDKALEGWQGLIEFVASTGDDVPWIDAMILGLSIIVDNIAVLWNMVFGFINDSETLINDFLSGNFIKNEGMRDMWTTMIEGLFNIFDIAYKRTIGKYVDRLNALIRQFNAISPRKMKEVDKDQVFADEAITPTESQSSQSGFGVSDEVIGGEGGLLPRPGSGTGDDGNLSRIGSKLVANQQPITINLTANFNNTDPNNFIKLRKMLRVELEKLNEVPM